MKIDVMELETLDISLLLKDFFGCEPKFLKSSLNL